MKRRLVILALLTAAVVGVTVGPASAASSTASGTFTTAAHLGGYTRLMVDLGKTSGYGCVLNKAVGKVIGAAQKSEQPEIAAASVVAGLANNVGSGFCKSTVTVAKMVAEAWLTYWRYGHVYIKQYVNPTYIWFYQTGLTLKQWIGPDAAHTREFDAQW